MVRIHVKWNEEKTTIDCELDTTIGEFKEMVGPKVDSTPNLIRLIFRGHILKENSRTLSSYGMACSEKVTSFSSLDNVPSAIPV